MCQLGAEGKGAELSAEESVDTVSGGAEPPIMWTSELDVDAPTIEIASTDAGRVASPSIATATKTLTLSPSVDAKLFVLGIFSFTAVAVASKFRVLVKYRQ
jgi:hypothetical protein